VNGITTSLLSPVVKKEIEITVKMQ